MTLIKDLINALEEKFLASGDYLCIDYRECKKNPIICVWVNEESGEFDPVTYWVSDSLEEFHKMLNIGK